MFQSITAIRKAIVAFTAVVVLALCDCFMHGNSQRNSLFVQSARAQEINFFGDTIRKRKPAIPAPSGLSKEQEFARRLGEKFPIPEVNYNPDEKPQYWTKGILSEFVFSQMSLSNWAAGGDGSVSLNSYLYAMANYEKGKMYWDNKIQLAYGFVQNFDVGYRKADDKIVIDSKWGYLAYKKLYFSAAFNFQSQFTPGFTYDDDNKATMVSKFLAPGRATLGLGVDFKPGEGKVLSVSLSPLTGSAVMVDGDSTMRVKYGNEAHEFVNWEFGAQLKVDFTKDLFKNFKVATQLSIFSDYLSNPLNMVINWDMQIDYSFNKFFKASIRTNLIYDDKVKIANSEGHEAARVQFKEIVGLNFSYTIGHYK